MSWGAQNQSEDAKTPSVVRAAGQKTLNWIVARSSHTPLYAQPRVLRHAMQTLEHFPRQYVVACAVHPNNAEVVLEVEAEELTVVEDLEGLLRNELRIFGATICHMSRRIDALEEDRATRR